MISYEDWESRKVKLADERFEPILGEVIGAVMRDGVWDEHRRVIGYKGVDTGTVVGPWFAEVMEQ
jgi:hypothetical protein